MSITESYQEAKELLFQSLAVVDTYIDGEHKPQSVLSKEWTQFDSSPGVYIKNITLFKPDTFAIAIIHGTKGSKQSHHQLSDGMEVHCTNGKLLMNGLEFKAGDRFGVPANQEYYFEFLEDTYLTIKFLPRNPQNFVQHEKANDDSK